MRKAVLLLGTAVLLGLSGCGHSLDKGRAFSLRPVSYYSLDGWNDDAIYEAMPALIRSCQKPAPNWKDFCSGLSAYKYASPARIRGYIEKKLTPYAVTAYGSDKGIITGYYEAELTGTRTKIKEGQVPVYAVPKGYKNGQRLPSRAQIESTPHYASVIAWADNPVDLFILQVQGSGRMETPDGEIKLGYAGNNGHTFKGLGQILKENGIKPEGGYSMPSIKKWLLAHPEQARALMAQNPRYIFFKEVRGDSPYGSAGVVLTPRRSVAVDKNYIPMHTPMWLDVKDPDGDKLNRLVVAQDVGNAIQGGIRADFFWGHGETAFDKAGRMKSSGKYYLLLPK
ncbi:MAG: murein transglycosylase A [Alphaproteobacteria bacterium]